MSAHILTHRSCFLAAAYQPGVYKIESLPPLHLNFISTFSFPKVPLIRTLVTNSYSYHTSSNMAAQVQNNSLYIALEQSQTQPSRFVSKQYLWVIFQISTMLTP